MSCGCGIQTYTEPVSGGVRIGGSAVVTSNRYNPTGGVKVGGAATVSTNQTWDGFEAVYHLDEQGNGTAGEYQNSTGHVGGRAANGIDTVNFPTQVSSGLYFEANSFDGNDYITCPKDTMADNSPMTVSIWISITTSFMERVCFSRGFTELTTAKGWQLQLGHTMFNTAFAQVQLIGTDNWNVHRVIGSTQLEPGCWYHLAVVFTPGASVKLYVDGVLEDTETITETTFAPSTLGHYFGRLDNKKYLDSVIQECRISPVARSGDWLLAEKNNLCDDNFYSVTGEQNPVYS